MWPGPGGHDSWRPAFFHHGATHELFDEESLGNELALRNGAAETRGRTSRVFDARGGGDSET